MPQTSETASNVLRIGIVSPLQQRDPRTNLDFVNILAVWQMFEPLYAPTSAGQTPTPLLLKEPLRLEPGSGGQRVYSAPILDKVKFSDGTPLTPEYAAASLRRNRVLSAAADIEVRGDRLCFKVKQNNVSLDVLLTRPDMSIVLERNREFLGTGPYMPAAGSTPERFHLVSNPHYRKKIGIPELEFLVYTRTADGRAEELRRALKEGRIDFTMALRRDEIQDLTTVRKSIELGTSTAILYFNAERPFLREAKVRKAMAHAVDRLAITKLFYSVPLAHTGSGILPPVMGQLADPINYDVDKARALLAAAGVKPPTTPLSLLVIWGPRPYLPRPVLVADLLARQFQKIGIEVMVKSSASIQDYYDRTNRGDYDMVLAGWIPDTPQAADFLDAVLSSECIPNGTKTVINGVNLSRWRNSAMDAALARCRNEDTDENRNAVARLVNEEMPFLALMYGPTVVVHGWRLRNYPASFLTYPFFHTMELQQ